MVDFDSLPHFCFFLRHLSSLHLNKYIRPKTLHEVLFIRVCGITFLFCFVFIRGVNRAALFQFFKEKREAVTLRFCNFAAVLISVITVAFSVKQNKRDRKLKVLLHSFRSGARARCRDTILS